jgi:FlaA1/EpsC-like NDP-sugar epimerase/lipopolysaccharide/colanic/teichoic acid biosynthesis glycosyltransferase
MRVEKFLDTNDNYPSGQAGKFQALILRTCDIFLSVIGLILTAPLFLLSAVFIKLNSKGPVFFSAERVGKDMMLFPMYKFRTMLENSVKIDQSVCPRFDPRVTTAGRFLRRTKLNELPQLLNILKGEMSFVGPRPEAPDLAEMYPEEAKRVFTVKPGLVGPVVISALKGDINGRNEEELYPQGVNAKQYYLEHILPEKVKIDLYYLSRQTVATYFKVIIAAAIETFSGAFSARQSDRSKRQIYLFIADFVLSQVSYALAYRLYVHLAGTALSFNVFIVGLLLVMIARSIFYYGFGLYKFVIELITPRDLYRAFQAAGVGSLLLLTINAFSAIRFYPPLLALVDFCLVCSLLIGVRLLILIRFRDTERMLTNDRRTRVVIFGANRDGLKALYALGRSKNSPYMIVGFIDDAVEKYGKKISGVKVLGNRHHIRALSVLHNVHEVILALDDKARNQIDEVLALCAQAGVRSRIFSENMEAETVGRISYPLRPPSLSDILPQVKVSLDATMLRSILPGKTVLMLGSGGELGSAVCRHIFSNGCKKIVIVDRYESYLRYNLTELRSDLPGFQIIPIVLDSQDIDGLNKVFALYHPHIVIHAGMRKFIPFEKTNDEEIARSNYVRTFNLAKVSARHGCEYFVMISSIKAARGGNFVSESLRVAEISLGRIFGETPTRLIVTRVGNIIENRGGIVSWLSNQILERKSVRLPAETAKAFLLSKNAAARSIMRALATGSGISPGGLLLTSEPGICLGFSEIARKIANFYGIKLGVDIAVNFGEISDVLVLDEPSMVKGAGDLAAVDSIESCLESEPVRLMIERMISDDTRNLSEHEWYRRTEEIISLCGSSLFTKKKTLFVN